MTFTLQDDSELWLTKVFANHYEEARSRADSLLSEGTTTETGCIVTIPQDRVRSASMDGRLCCLSTDLLRSQPVRSGL